MANPRPTVHVSTREDFIRAYEQYTHDMPRNAPQPAFITPADVPRATQQQWARDAQRAAVNRANANVALANVYLHGNDNRAPTPEEQAAWRYEASRHMTEAQFTAALAGQAVPAAMQRIRANHIDQRERGAIEAGIQGVLAGAGIPVAQHQAAQRDMHVRIPAGLDGLFERNRQHAVDVNAMYNRALELGRDVELLQDLFKPESPLLPGGPDEFHLAAFRRVNPLFAGPMSPGIALYYLRAFYAVSHLAWGELLGPIPMHIGVAVGHIIDGNQVHGVAIPRYAQRVLIHLAGIQRDPDHEQRIAHWLRLAVPQFERDAAPGGAVFNPPAPAELQAMVDAAVAEEDDGELLPRLELAPAAEQAAAAPFEVLQVPAVDPARYMADLQRLINEWERDVSPAGVEKRNVQLTQHLLSLPTDKDRATAAERVWQTHPDWLSVQGAMSSCRAYCVQIIRGWILTLQPMRPELLAMHESIQCRQATMANIIEHAKAASLHHWPCLDDTLFLVRLLQTTPDIARTRILQRIFTDHVPFVPVTAPSLDDVDWERFYRPVLQLVPVDERVLVTRSMIGAMSVVSDKLSIAMARDVDPDDGEAFAESIYHQGIYVDTTRNRMAVARRMADEKAAARAGAGKPDAEAKEGAPACAVCHSNERRVRYDPCGCFACCHACTARMQQGAGVFKCPTCNTPVDIAQPCFMP